MSCVEKRHMSHRGGNMLHHRFPNAFTDLLMDETDREVSTLTDRAFRSLCVGDDAVYNDEFLYGYSPFSCHKPLAADPQKKSHHKDSKKQGKNKKNKNVAQPWKEQQKDSISHMSSFLKALSVTEQSCEGMLIKNGGMTDSKGESWDKSALRSIQRELSEFSTDYHANLKDVDLPTGKSSKTKKGKSNIKLRKLNIKNLFLHSEFSPFQTWRDFNRFPFGQRDTVLRSDNVPPWYDMPFFNKLTEAHIKQTRQKEELQTCQKVSLEPPPPPTAPKRLPPTPPPKVLPKLSASSAENMCSPYGGDESSAPWRRNKSTTKSVVPVNPRGIPPPAQEKNSKTVDESLFLVKKEVRSVVVKAVEEVSSLASTPFSICQLMTPVIPSRQPTETSEILQGIMSPSALDLRLRPQSEAKLTPETPLKRDSYKSLASSILFNLKDNRKRVKSRYSPPKFKTLELPGGAAQSPNSDYVKHRAAGSEANASGFSTPAVLKDGPSVYSPVLESKSTTTVGLNKQDGDRPPSVDYLLSNLLQNKKEPLGSSNPSEENTIPPLIHSKITKSPIVQKQNYPSLNLYKKANPADSELKYLPVPSNAGGPVHTDQLRETNNKPSPLPTNKELSQTVTEPSPNTSSVSKDQSPIMSPNALETEGNRPPNAPDKTKPPENEIKHTNSGATPISCKERDNGGQPLSTMDVIRAAREAINAAKSKALLAVQADGINKTITDREDLRGKELDTFNIPKNPTITSETGKKANVKKDPPPVPKRNFTKSDVQLHVEQQQTCEADRVTNGETDLPPTEAESVQKQGKMKHLFSARQNSYIKCHRYSAADDGQREELDEDDPKVNLDGEMMSLSDMSESKLIMNDLQALKELERARLGDRALDNAKIRLGPANIDEETRAKNDLIARELRNIKKGMLSMRGNTSAKRELLSIREKDPNREEAFTKLDGNVTVNKALFNDNYDKAKMALEEIISERQKRKSRLTGHDHKTACQESYVKRVQQRKKSIEDFMIEDRKNQNDNNLTVRENDFKQRLGDLRDHHHMSQILSQTEPGPAEPHLSATSLPDRDKISNKLNTLPKITDKNDNKQPGDSLSYEIEDLRQVERQSSEDLMIQNEGKLGAAPPVPPRSRKSGSRRDVGVVEKTDDLRDGVGEEIVDRDRKHRNDEVKNDLKEERRSAEKQKVDSDLLTEEFVLSQQEPGSDKEKGDVVKISQLIAGTDPATNDSILASDPEPQLCLSAEFTGNENEAETCPAVAEQETHNLKQKVSIKQDPNTSDNQSSNSLTAEDRRNRAAEEINVDPETLSEISRNIISPVLLVNGLSINQSPPDQSSLSSKSSYFSIESALHRNTETESNIYHSLENLIGEMEEVEEVPQKVSRNTNRSPDKMSVEYYSLSDHGSEPEVKHQPPTSPQKETDAEYKDGLRRENDPQASLTHDDNNQTPMSPSSTFSPPLVIPALFKVKDNTFSGSKVKKTIQPWSTRGSLGVSEKEEEELHEELPLANEPASRSNKQDPDETSELQENSFNSFIPPLLQPPSSLQTENQKTPEFGVFLTVPQEEDRFSEVSPSSEGVESLTTSTADTTVESGMNIGITAELDVLKVPSERSGSTGSGNDSQTGLPKPPAVLPKSEKAVLKAIKLTSRRMKKEEAQKSSHRSSQSNSKQKVDRQKSDRSQQRSSNRNSKSSEKMIDREKMEDGPSHSDSHDRSEHLVKERRGKNSENHHQERHNVVQKTRRQSNDKVESSNQNAEAVPRPGRSSNRQTRDQPEPRDYSSDRIISNVPVYKVHVNDRPTSDRPLHRSQSSDRYLQGKKERRFSADMSITEKLDPRSQRVERSIISEFQQRGRAREKVSRENPLRRSHSIDAYSSEVPHRSSLSRQSSHSSQLSCQSSMEHTIMAQTFPVTQRKLLQDPDSGQYFFVDMPIQVKTKTFFDPETGNYVQIPVQPPEGAVPQASPLEVLNPPLGVYHGFVPVPLSPMAQKARLQARHIPQEEMEQRYHERSMQMLCQERQQYPEPVYPQQDLLPGEFSATEELDCPS